MIRRSPTLVVAAVLAGLLLPTASAGAQSSTPPDGEIIGGQTADPGEYPYQVALLIAGRANRFLAQFCGGSLISPDTVLTAAHCLEGATAGEIDVLAGTNSLAQGGGGTRVPARRLRIHPGYNPRTLGNDIGIVQLGVSLPYPLIRTIQPGEDTLWDPGTVATVTGWGNVSRFGIRFPKLLHEVEVPIRSDRYCGHPGRYGSEFIGSKMFCAGNVDGGEDSCQGDSGGPIVVPDDPSGRVLVGIVSWGIDCALPEFPGIYTELAAYSGFVNPYLDPDSPPHRVERLRGQQRTATSFRMTWRPPTFDGGTRITRYRVKIPALGRDHGVAGDQTFFRLRDLPAGRHLVQVVAANAVGTSPARTVAIDV